MSNLDSEAKKHFATRIKVLREQRGWTQSKLAEKAGLTDGAIKMIETGRRWPRSETMQQIAKAFGIATSALIETASKAEQMNADTISSYVQTLERERNRLRDYAEEVAPRIEELETQLKSQEAIADIMEALSRVPEKTRNAVRVALGLPEKRASREKKQTS